MNPSRPTRRWREWPAGAAPALLVLAVGLGTVLVRPPLPIDETRYLEVFLESLKGSPLLLSLGGEPYAEKPPLLFWLARALDLVLPASFALRALPALASALTVLFVARLGRRLGLDHVGWLQATLCLPGLASQLLLFDPLLAAAVWGAVDGWSRGRSGVATLWSAAALLAKGPVALLFLAPFLWSLVPAETGPSRWRRRAARVLALALLPLAGWALLAAARGGPEFARALLWERWAGRIGGNADHSRPLWFYLPVALIGALPVTPLLLRRGMGVPDWHRRLGRALLVQLLVFTLIRGKQAHYLIPLAPGVALLAAWTLAHDAGAWSWLRRGLRALHTLPFLAAVAAVFLLPWTAGSVSAVGAARIEDGSFRVPLVAAALLALGGWLLAGRNARSPGGPSRLFSSALLLQGASLLPLHWVAGELIYPSHLAAALAGPAPRVAFLGSSQHGLYALLAHPREPEKLADAGALPAWAQRNPGGLLVLERDRLVEPCPPGYSPVANDRVHRVPVLVLRADPAPRADPPAATSRLLDR